MELNWIDRHATRGCLIVGLQKKYTWIWLGSGLLAAASFGQALAQAPGAVGGGPAAATAPSSAGGAAGGNAATGGTAGLPGTATVGRTLSLPDVVSLAVGSNSGLELARLRLQRAQELISQVNAQVKPQFRATANDAYNSYPAFPSVIPLPTITNPTLPDGGQIPAVVDQASGIPTGFAGQPLSTGGLSGSVSPGVSSGGGSASAGGSGSAGATAGTPGGPAGSAATPASGASANPAGGAGGGAGQAGPANSGAGASTGAPSIGGSADAPATGGSTSGGAASSGQGQTTGTGAAGSPSTSPGSSSSPGSNAGPRSNAGPTTTSPGTNGSGAGGTGPGSGSAGASLIFIPAIVTGYVADPRTLTQPLPNTPAITFSSARDAAAQAHQDPHGGEEPAEKGQTPLTAHDSAAAPGNPTGTAPTTSRAVGKRDTYATGLSISQYIDLFGIAGATRRVEQSEGRFYALDITRLQNETALVAKNLFFNALYAQALVETQQEQVQFAQENVRITQSRLRNGIVSRYDVLTAEATLANAQQQLLAAQDQQEQAQANLAYLLGTNPNQALALQAPALPPLVQTVDLTQSTQTALRRRPELAQARSNIGEAQGLVRLAGNGLLPTLGLVGSGEYTSNGSTVTPRSYATLSAQLAVPLDDGGYTRSRVRAARLDVRTQTILSEQLALSISLEVRQAAINIRNAQGQVSAAAAGLVQAQEARRLALERYTAGLGTFLDVLNAQATLAATRTNLANAQFFYQSSLAQLVRALGGR